MRSVLTAGANALAGGLVGAARAAGCNGNLH